MRVRSIVSATLSLAVLPGLLLLTSGRCPAAGAPIQWSWAHPHPTPYDLNAVAFGDGRFVAVGDRGTFLTSVDGVNWVAGTSGAFADLYSVVHGGATWVAVGSFGTVYTSTDGFNWTPQHPGLFANLRGVTYGNGLFVAVGEDTSIATSPDGITWSLSLLGTAALNAVTYGNGLFVAVGRNDLGLSFGTPVSEALIMTSHDGVSWTPRDSRRSVPLGAVAHNGTRFVAVAGTGGTPVIPAYLGPTIVTSSDGTNWFGRFWSDYGFSGAVVAGNGGFFALNHRDTVEIQRSEDGISWSWPGVRIPGWEELYREHSGAAFGHERLVLVGPTGRIAVSTDGTDFRDPTGDVQRHLQALAYGAGRFVGAGRRGVTLTSPGGSVWTTHSLDPNLELEFLVHGTDQFIGLGVRTHPHPEFPGNELNVEELLTSPDGVTWHTQSTNTSMEAGNWQGLAYGEGALVAINDHLALHSTDGTNWMEWPIGLEPSLQLEGVHYGNGQFVIVARRSDFQFCESSGYGETPVVLISPTGATWTESPLDCNLRNLSITSGPGTFLAVNGSETYYLSPDAINWTPHSFGLGASFYEAIHANGLFLVVSTRDLAVTSPDGLVWESHELVTPMYISALAGGGGAIVLAGTDEEGRGLIIATAQELGAAPAISEEPDSLTVAPGGAWSLAVRATGTRPLFYQWLREGVPIPDANRPVLEFPNVQEGDAGSYSVVVTNAFGQATSSPATLAVEAASARLSLNLASAEVLLDGPLGQTWRVEYGDHLQEAETWQPLGTRHLWSSPTTFTGTVSTNGTSRFYRAVMVP